MSIEKVEDLMNETAEAIEYQNVIYYIIYFYKYYLKKYDNNTFYYNNFENIKGNF